MGHCTAERLQLCYVKLSSVETLPCIHIEDLFYGYLHNWPPIGLGLASTVPIHKKALAFNGNRLAEFRPPSRIVTIQHRVPGLLTQVLADWPGIDSVFANVSQCTANAL